MSNVVCRLLYPAILFMKCCGVKSGSMQRNLAIRDDLLSSSCQAWLFCFLSTLLSAERLVDRALRSHFGSARCGLLSPAAAALAALSAASFPLMFSCPGTHVRRMGRC